MPATAPSKPSPRVAATKLRNDLVGSGSTRATPVLDAAAKLGYSVREFEGEYGGRRIDGAIRRKPVPTIYVNAQQASGRRRFTIAHELGHAVLHAADLEEDGFVDFRGDFNYGLGGSGREAEANEFAAHLLMPGEVFESLWAAFDGSLASVADHLGVSRAAAEVRADRLGLL